VTRFDRSQARALGAGAAALAMALLAGCSEPPPDEAVAQHVQLFGRYCTDCHNDAEAAGDMSLEHVTPEQVAAKPEVFEQVIRKLRGGLMPPPGEPRPDLGDRRALVGALERHLDATAAARGPEPGRVALHRMNRTEYAGAVEQLLGMRIDARSMLPADMASEGFDNVAEVLRVTPTHIEQYVAAARDISIMAVGEKKPAPTRADYRSERGLRTAHVDGLPLGTRDGLLVEHDFPADGTYEINLNISSIPGSELRGYPYGWLEYEHTVAVTIDGAKVFLGNIGGEADSKALDQGQIKEVEAIKNRFRGIRVDVKAGHRRVGAAFVARSFAEGDYLLQSLVPGEGVPDIPRLYGMEIIGPYDPTGIAEPTESRARIFSCYPQNESEEQACATQILTNLARGAFRRPVTSEDVAPALEFYAQGRAGGDFETGIQKGLMAILASTKFLYRAEPGAPPANLEQNSSYAVSDLELAWRLSFFLWSQGPDDALLELAQAGTLHEPDVLDRQVRRMLADERSRSLVTNFAFQWLGVRRLEAIDPDPRLYPTFDEDLRRAFTKEMELYLDSILRSDASVVDLLTAKHTFVNERLARHYGIADVRGDQFRRVELTDSHRFGLFGKGSVLMVTSYPDRTSPVLRGAWIMEQILAAPPNPPPPGVETDLAPAGEVPKSVRERLALHRTQTSCNQCHGVIDPLGQALENFDAIGEWRVKERDSGVLVDSTGTTSIGQPVNSPQELRAALSSDPTLFVHTLTEKLLTFALGRGLEYYDMPVVRRIVADASAQGYSFESIVLGVARSVPFRMRSAAEEPAGG
jgi:mono/diheme cytochrome c family protein